MFKSDLDAETEIRLADKAMQRGRFKRARLHISAALSLDPTNVRVQAALSRVDAELGRKTLDDALREIQDLANQHPTDSRLPGALASILFRLGRKDESIQVRRQYLEQFPDSTYALQMWANGLQAKPNSRMDVEVQGEAWEYFKKALAIGPLSSACFMAAAYHAARVVNPDHATMALAGSTLDERLSIRTRQFGPQRMMGLFFVSAFVSIFLWQRFFPISVVAQIITIAWGGWCVHANDLMCCKKCRNAWLRPVVLYGLLFVLFDDIHLFWYVAAVAIALVILGMRNGVFKPLISEGEKQRFKSGLDSGLM